MFNYLRTHLGDFFALSVVLLIWWICLALRGWAYFSQTAPTVWLAIVAIATVAALVIGLFPWRELPAAIALRLPPEPTFAEFVAPAIPDVPDGETEEAANARVADHAEACRLAAIDHDRTVAHAMEDWRQACTVRRAEVHRQWQEAFRRSPHVSYGYVTGLFALILVVAIIGQTIVVERKATGYAVRQSDVQVATLWGGLYRFDLGAMSKTRVEYVPSDHPASSTIEVVRLGWNPAQIDSVEQRPAEPGADIRAYNCRFWANYEKDAPLPATNRLAACPNITSLEVRDKQQKSAMTPAVQSVATLETPAATAQPETSTTADADSTDINFTVTVTVNNEKTTVQKPSKGKRSSAPKEATKPDPPSPPEDGNQQPPTTAPPQTGGSPGACNPVS